MKAEGKCYCLASSAEDMSALILNCLSPRDAVALVRVVGSLATSEKGSATIIPSDFFSTRKSGFVWTNACQRGPA